MCCDKVHGKEMRVQINDRFVVLQLFQRHIVSSQLRLFPAQIKNERLMRRSEWHPRSCADKVAAAVPEHAESIFLSLFLRNGQVEVENDK